MKTLKLISKEGLISALFISVSFLDTFASENWQSVPERKVHFKLLPMDKYDRRQLTPGRTKEESIAMWQAYPMDKCVEILKALDELPLNVKASLGMGVILDPNLRSKTFKALEEYKILARVDPTSNEAKEKLIELKKLQSRVAEAMKPLTASVLTYYANLFKTLNECKKI